MARQDLTELLENIRSYYRKGKIKRAKAKAPELVCICPDGDVAGEGTLGVSFSSKARKRGEQGMQEHIPVGGCICHDRKKKRGKYRYTWLKSLDAYR